MSEEIIKNEEIGTLVLGLPKNMNNSLGTRAMITLEFKEMLERRSGISVVLWDERLTTVEAERTLIESKVRRHNFQCALPLQELQLHLHCFLNKNTFL